jgi:hypothetical protein
VPGRVSAALSRTQPLPAAETPPDFVGNRDTQFAVPGFVRRQAGNLTDRDGRLWRAVAACVIASEIALLIEQTMPYAAVAGIGMHAAFTCLKPASSSPSPASPSAPTSPSPPPELPLPPPARWRRANSSAIFRGQALRERSRHGSCGAD